VALTGFGQEQDKEKATSAGFDAHLTKPADEATLAGIFAYPRPNGT
jgi:CheY-like chemotaxis protein